MLTEEQVKFITKHELIFHTSRSGGKGGQNVNKVETKVEVEFDLQNSKTLSDTQKTTIFKIKPSYAFSGIIKVSSSKHRSQLENKIDATQKLIALLNKLLKPVKKRKATKPSKAAKQKKMDNKQKNSEKKQLRQKIR